MYFYFFVRSDLLFDGLRYLDLLLLFELTVNDSSPTMPKLFNELISILKLIALEFVAELLLIWVKDIVEKSVSEITFPLLLASSLDDTTHLS